MIKPRENKREKAGCIFAYWLQPVLKNITKPFSLEMLWDKMKAVPAYVLTIPHKLMSPECLQSKLILICRSKLLLFFERKIK